MNLGARLSWGVSLALLFSCCAHLDGRLAILIAREEETSAQTQGYLSLVTDQVQVMNLLDWLNLWKEMVCNPFGWVLKSSLNEILENWLWEGVFCWQKMELDDLRRVLCLKCLMQRQTEISDGSRAQDLQSAFSKDKEFKCTCSSSSSVTRFPQGGVMLWVALVWLGSLTFRGQ